MKFLKIALFIITASIQFSAFSYDAEKELRIAIENETKLLDKLILDLPLLDVTDGVNLEEAETIVNAIYYSRLGDGCGAPGKIDTDGNYWKVPTFSGLVAKPDAPIYIHKVTGVVTRRGSVLTSSPSDIELILPLKYVKRKK